MENNHFVLYWFCQFWTTLIWILMNMMLIVDFDCMYIFHLRPLLIFPKLHNKNISFSWYFEDDYVITDWEAPVALGNHCSHLLSTGVWGGGSVWWHRIIFVRLFISSIILPYYVKYIDGQGCTGPSWGGWSWPCTMCSSFGSSVNSGYNQAEWWNKFTTLHPI